VKEIIICTDDSGKGRSFRATLLAYATSKSLWAAGSHDNVRPIFAMLATTDAESLPFIRNLQAGRKATMLNDDRNAKKETFECLKSANYAYEAQRHPEGVVWTVYLPELYRVDPGMVDPAAVRFAMAPAAKWLASVDESTARWLAGLYRSDEKWRAAEEHAKRLAICQYVTRLASVFCERLDTRTRCPLIPDARFYALVLAAMLDAGQATLARKDTYGSDREWAHSGCNFVEWGDVGLMPGIAVSTTHALLEPLLAACVKTYEASSVGDSRIPKAA
jgi:hypothetical protein